MSEPQICPECGQPLVVPERRVRLIVCQACRKPVSLTAAASAPRAGAVRGAASRKTAPSEPSSVATPPWARLPEPIDPPLPPPRRAMNRWTLLKLAILIVVGLCGFWAFFQALGSFVLQPAIPRRVLFPLYAGYWLGTALVAAALFDWRFPSAGGEPRGLRRRFGGRTTRYLLAACGAAIILPILWLVI